MKGASLAGFTIIEVLLVLGISGMMLVMAALAFGGESQSAAFTQAMYDLQSKFRSIASDVSSDSVPGLQQYSCAPSTPTVIGGRIRPVLTPGNAVGQSCIYLGQAVVVTTGDNTVNSYPVFGLRTIYSGSTDTGNFPASVDQANPEPAVDSTDPTNPNSLLLVDAYSIPDNLQVVSAKFNGSENDLLTLFSSLQSNNTSGNEIAVASLGYTGPSSDSPNLQVKNCMEGTSCSGYNSATSTTWDLCLADPDGRQASMSVRGTPTGIVTTLNLNGCS